MVWGAPDEARWRRPEPRRHLPRAVLERIVDQAFPQRRLLDAEPLNHGLRNLNLKLRVESAAEPVVLRIYEHDPSLCQKEMDLFALVGKSVPLPEILYACACGSDCLPPFVMMRFVEGIGFRELRRSGDRDATAEAAFSIGETLAAIGRFKFAKSGWIGPALAVTAPLLEGEDPLPRFVDLCLQSENLQQRVPADLRGRVSELVWRWARPLNVLTNGTQLVHGDFNRRNVLVRDEQGRWKVSAVLDWEFAVSGSPLADIGNFLRYEVPDRPRAEPHFSRGYLSGGGTLPEAWRFMAGLLDLAAICESLTHDDLTSLVVAELIELAGSLLRTEP